MTLSDITDEIESICDDSAALSAGDIFDHVHRTLRVLTKYTRARHTGSKLRASGLIEEAKDHESAAESLLARLRKGFSDA